MIACPRLTVRRCSANYAKMLRVSFPNSQDLPCTYIVHLELESLDIFFDSKLVAHCGCHGTVIAHPVTSLQETDQGAAHALDDTIQSQSLYESPAFRVSREGLDELLAEVRRVDALITNKPPGHPVSSTALTGLHFIVVQLNRLLRFWVHYAESAVHDQLSSPAKVQCKLKAAGLQNLSSAMS